MLTIAVRTTARLVPIVAESLVAAFSQLTRTGQAVAFSLPGENNPRCGKRRALNGVEVPFRFRADYDWIYVVRSAPFRWKRPAATPFG